MAGQQRFFDPSQPQTLQIATLLLYFDAVLAFLSLALPFTVAYAGAAYGMANGKKWGYGLAVGVAVLGLLTVFVLVQQWFPPQFTVLSIDLVLRVRTIQLMFAVALLALLLHPQSREYQKIWYS
ncbi:MAG TPA: hypothetical protein VG795_11855 [Acidimicrobiia bacterium]|nr:hypothetical protein [Acidimicrobiia bacterium]